ncbi:DUF3703 domain-containing protein [Chitinimonas arctica]|uniref:DUF3703 domain-containing protein n=1 Tax=Chitinimonas arctica TaxID=2594795 RepID=A0A516SFR3_9NEIS|nr:DUF3703 domain-containing protein [Chitinimonas arctica]QDQ27006.1 DUF3703 domain-containing protein [Chitinimonas arctica]
MQLSPLAESAYQQAMADAQAFCLAGQYEAAFAQLERAHILGQQALLLHWRVHLAMLRVALAQSNRTEGLGQLWRLFLTPFGHLVNRLPVGNTGRANISAFKPMPIPEELRRIMAP